MISKGFVMRSLVCLSCIPTCNQKQSFSPGALKAPFPYIYVYIYIYIIYHIYIYIYMYIYIYISATVPLGTPGRV